jgi:hypothetical protein
MNKLVFKQISLPLKRGEEVKMDSKKLSFRRSIVLLSILFALIGFIYAPVIIGDENPKDAEKSIQEEQTLITPADTVICGDVNGVGISPYGNLTLADAVYLWSFLFRGGASPVPDTCAGDANGDGTVSTADWMVPIKYLYKDAAPPVDYCCDSVGQRQLPVINAPGNIAVFADTLDNFMRIENTTARPGVQGHVINIFGSWNAELGAYGMVLLFDTSKIDIVEVSLTGTVGEEGMLVSNYLGNYSPLKAALHLYNYIPADSGILFKIVINVKETAPPGETDLILVNQPGAPPWMCDYALSDGINDILPELIPGTLSIEVLCGDVNGDGGVTVSDVTYAVNYLFKGGSPPLCAPEPYLACGDVNSDDQVSVSDVVYLISYLFKGGPEPDCPPTGILTNYIGCKRIPKVSATDSISPDQDCLEYYYDGEGVLELKHINAGFNCCPDELLADISVEGNVITIEERESLSNPCHCLCLFDLDLRIINLEPGEYVISVIEPYVFMDEERINFTINLSLSPSSGIYCVKRSTYPWGI